MIKKEIVASLDTLGKVANYLTKTLPENVIVFLRGDLAAGKTTLTQAVAKVKNVESEVTSPTFSLQHNYGEELYHYDLYRLDHEEFMQMGLLEEFEKTGWHMVEWGSKELEEFLKAVGYNVVIVEIMVHDEERIYRITI